VGKLLTLIIFLLFSTGLLARPKKKLVDITHDHISYGVLSFSKNIDDFFGEEDETEPINKSKFRIYTTTLKTEGKVLKTLLLYKFKLVLPKTQKRLQIIIEPEGDDAQEGIGGTVSGNTPTKTKATTTAESLQNSTTAALRFIVDTAGIKTSVDTGIIANIPPLPFIRIRLRRDVPLKDHWVFRVKETIKWIHDDRTTSDLDLNFDRPLGTPLGKSFLFRMVNNIFWDDFDYIIALRNGPSLFHTINSKIGMNYNAHILSTNSPSFQVENYLISVGFRQLLYKNWFFWQLSPALEFPRIENFHRTPSLTIRFEAVFGTF